MGHHSPPCKLLNNPFSFDDRALGCQFRGIHLDRQMFVESEWIDSPIGCLQMVTHGKASFSCLSPDTFNLARCWGCSHIAIRIKIYETVAEVGGGPGISYTIIFQPC